MVCTVLIQNPGWSRRLSFISVVPSVSWRCMVYSAGSEGLLLKRKQIKGPDNSLMFSTCKIRKKNDNVIKTTASFIKSCTLFSTWKFEKRKNFDHIHLKFRINRANGTGYWSFGHPDTQSPGTGFSFASRTLVRRGGGEIPSWRWLGPMFNCSPEVGPSSIGPRLVRLGSPACASACMGRAVAPGMGSELYSGLRQLFRTLAL